MKIIISCMAVRSPGLPVWPCRSGLCMWGSSMLQREGISQQDAHGTEGRRRRRTGQMDCGGRSSTGGRPSGSSHRLPKSCGSEWEGDVERDVKKTTKGCGEIPLKMANCEPTCCATFGFGPSSSRRRAKPAAVLKLRSLKKRFRAVRNTSTMWTGWRLQWVK